MQSGAYKFQRLIGSMTEIILPMGDVIFVCPFIGTTIFSNLRTISQRLYPNMAINIYHYISSNSQNPNTQNQNSTAWYHKVTLKESRRDGGALRGKGGDFLSVFLWLPSPLTEERQKEIYNDDVSFCHSLQGGSAKRKSYALRVPKKGRIYEKNRTFVL